MRFTISGCTACTGGNHVSGLISVNGGATKPFRIVLSELTHTEETDMPEDRIIARLRSAVLEAGATTLVQARNAIQAQEFRV